MSELQFPIDEVLLEIETISDIAGDFIAPESRATLRELKGTLEVIRDSRSTNSFGWGIPESRPLKTRVSAGEYEKGRSGADSVFAEVTSNWSIRCVPRHKKSLLALVFEMTSSASTRIRICDAADGSEIAMWRMEIADDASPGCHFHVQVRGQTTERPFPQSLSVPRLPSIHMTPSAVLDFVLGELFQDDWARKVAAGNQNVRRLGAIHRRWLGKLLDWQSRTVRESVTSPWLGLKHMKPPADLLLEIS